MNDNQLPELPKVNTNNLDENQKSTINENVIDNNEPVVLQTLPTEEKKDSETVKMVNEVKETAVKEANNIFKFLKDVFKYITTRNSSDLLALLWRLVLIAAFIIVLYVPFQLLRDLGTNVLIMFGVNFTNALLNMWNSIWNILYGIIGIVLFFVLCKDRYYKLVKSQEDVKKVINENK